jgi:hypothetical protein
LSSLAPASGAAVANASAVTDAPGGECSDLLGSAFIELDCSLNMSTLNMQLVLTANIT